MKDPEKDLKDVLVELARGAAKRPILAFGLLIIVMVAIFGGKIPAEFRSLIYIVVIGAMVIDVVRFVVPELRGRRVPGAGSGEREEQEAGATPIAERKRPTTEALPESAAPEKARETYLDGVIADCRRARLVGLDPQAADPGRGGMSLDRLYVSLDTTAQVEVEDEDEKKAPKKDRPIPEEKRHPLSVLEALKRERRMVLLGLPGSGKSTFLRYLSLRMAQALKDTTLELKDLLPGWDGRPRLPLIVPLGAFAAGIPAGTGKGSAALLEGFIRQLLSADEQTRGFGDRLFPELEKEGGLLLFDGLDEVASTDLRPVVVGAIEALADKYGRRENVRFVVTCRTFSYTDRSWQLTGWPAYELAPFSEEKIKEFVHAWHNELSRVDPARKEDYERKRGKLLESLEPGDRRRLHEIADNPLILTIMAVVHTHKGELPDTRALVYEECVDILLLRWELERSSGLRKDFKRRSLLDALSLSSRIELERALWKIAYQAHASLAGTGGSEDRRCAALVTEELMYGILHTAFHDDAKVKTFLDYCESANGLLMLQGVPPAAGSIPGERPCRIYAFPHLTFQEYLAARYLRIQRNLGSEMRSHLDRSDRWREVTMLLAEHILFREGDFELMDGILEALAPAGMPGKRSTSDWRALWMAGDLLLLYRRALKSEPKAGARIRQGLSVLIGESELAPRERAAAGDTLAALGDPRPEVMTVDKMQFCFVPAGPFYMGEGSEEHRNDCVNYNFWISRYPVTTAQFKVFLEDSGLKPGDADCLKGFPNHPVVWVSWYEALGFCKWLTERWRKDAFLPGNWKVTLPSEAEWEKAARGGVEIPEQLLISEASEMKTRGKLSMMKNPKPKRVYPWGEEPDPNLANYGDTGVNSTSAVGCFAGGASPYGCREMSGNVWEWTRSLWGKDWSKPDHEYPYQPDDGRENLDAPEKVARGLRGGSFDGDPGAVRCASRYGYYPYYRRGSYGFRCVLSPLKNL